MTYQINPKRHIPTFWRTVSLYPPWCKQTILEKQAAIPTASCHGAGDRRVVTAMQDAKMYQPLPLSSTLQKAPHTHLASSPKIVTYDSSSQFGSWFLRGSIPWTYFVSPSSMMQLLTRIKSYLGAHHTSKTDSSIVTPVQAFILQRKKTLCAFLASCFPPTSVKNISKATAKTALQLFFSLFTNHFKWKKMIKKTDEKWNKIYSLLALCVNYYFYKRRTWA